MQVMETRKRVLGQEHPDTLSSMANLAFTTKDQSRKEEAIEVMVECVQLRTVCCRIAFTLETHEICAMLASQVHCGCDLPGCRKA